MIDQIEVRTSQGALLGLPLDDVSNGFAVEVPEGLGPVKATLVSSSFAQIPGEQQHSSRRERRDIKMQIGLEPDYATTTVRQLRLRLYEFFMPESEINLRFYMSDGLIVNIVGTVETCEPAIFTPEPAMEISIACFDPDFKELNPTSFNGTTVVAAIETEVDYDGTISTGLKFTLNVNRTENAFTIYHRLPNGELRMLEFNGALVNGDVLTINTVRGSKSATVTHLSGTTESVLYGISPQSSWLELMPGENFIYVYTDGAAIPYTIEYTKRHGGL